MQTVAHTTEEKDIENGDSRASEDLSILNSPVMRALSRFCERYAHIDPTLLMKGTATEVAEDENA